MKKHWFYPSTNNCAIFSIVDDYRAIVDDTL